MPKKECSISGEKNNDSERKILVTEISLNTVCGHTTKIIATKEGKNTHVHIKTTCEKLRKWGTHFDMDMKDLMGGPETPKPQRIEI